MHKAEFLDQVQARADLPTTERAEQITTGVLETLGERLAFGEQDRLAAQLPKPLKELLHQRPRTDDQIKRVCVLMSRCGRRARPRS